MAKLTDDQIVEMAELREADWSTTALAQRYGVSHNTVSRLCYAQGAIPSKGLPKRNPRKWNAPAGRGKAVASREMDKMWSLRLKGYSVQQIAQKLERPRATVYYWLERLAIEQEAAS